MSVIGKPTPQVTAREKVLGLAQYVGDMKLAGMLHAKVLRSPYPHARIVNVDVSRARAVPGVKAVLTGADTPARLFGNKRKEHRILAAGKVRFAGEEVVAVAASDESAALDAIELVRVEYEELPAVFDPEDALRSGAPEVHEGTRNVAYEINITRGDVEAAFARAAAVYEATYETSYQYPAYLEPMGTLAAVDGNGKVTVWLPTHSVFAARARLAEALDIPASHVRVIQSVTGGGFGGKNNEDMSAPIAALLAQRTGRPVRLVNTRLEDFLAARAGLPVKIRLKMGLAADGEIVAKESDIVADNGAYTCLAPGMMHVTAMRSDSLHRHANVRTRARLVFTNKIPSGALRGFGNPQMHFALNSHLSVLAGMLGMDPVDVHLRNAIRTGETSVHGWHMGSCGLSECLERARDAVEWEKKHGRRLGTGTRRRGVGIAAAIHVSGNREIADWDGASVAVRVNEDGRVVVITSESDVGQGSNTMLCQLCAHELGVPLEYVSVNAPDTDVAAFGWGSIASRVTMAAGNAAIRAAREARSKIIDIVSRKLETAPQDLTIENGIVHVVGVPGRSMTVGEAARAHLIRSGGEAIYTRATWDSPTVMADKNYYGNVSAAYSFAAQSVEVEVDTETGQVRVLDSYTVEDCGRALNPLAVHGQTNGATTQGIGWALYEQYQFEEGRLVNGNFADYTLPTTEAVPALRADVVESNDPNGPHGAKGASETAVCPAAPAIANAVFDAVGVRVNSLPITPEKILAGLRALREGAAGA